MTGQCGLRPDINNCQHYVRECAGCNAPHDKCGMFLPAGDKRKDDGQERRAKWYEQYYK